MDKQVYIKNMKQKPYDDVRISIYIYKNIDCLFLL